MIVRTMAVVAAGEQRSGRAEQAREAHFARLVALILDTIFVGILSGLVTSVYGLTTVSGVYNPTGATYWNTQTTLPAMWTAVIWIAYYTVFEAMFSATPGKALNRLCVVSFDDRPLTLTGILLRNLLRLLDVLPGMYLLGGIMVLSTAHSQRIGDFAGHTTVVFRRHAVEPSTTRTSDRRARLALVAAVLVALAFSAGFDYFGRPPLEIQKAYQEHQLMNPDLIGYSLGAPTWSWGHVRYPLTAREPGKTCTGWVELEWYGIWGWQQSSGELDCFPAT